LPNRLPTIEGVELAAHYGAAGLGAEVGGDWYDAFALPHGQLGIVLGDVAGRSIPAATKMGQLRTVTTAFALGEGGSRPPGEVLTRLNRYQLALGEEGIFTVLYVVLDPRAGTLRWANAGHLPPLVRTTTTARYIDGGDGLMGIDDTEYQTLEAELKPAWMLVLYTDGLVERRGESLDAGLERLADAVRSGPARPDAMCRHILDQLLPHEDRLGDDVTALLAQVL
jgi:phosphoserine phosphatase RsbU/P